jgi:hypothetical protein
MLNISTTDVQKKSQQLYFEIKKPSDFVGTGQGWWRMAGAIGK